MKYQHLITKSLKRHMPDFCYMTTFEILLFLEAIHGVDTDINFECLKVIIKNLSKEGKIIKRRVTSKLAHYGKQVAPRYEYTRNPNWRIA